MLMMEHAIPLTRSTVPITSTNYHLWKGKCSTPQKTASVPVGQKILPYKDPILRDWTARVLGRPTTMTSATSLRKNRSFWPVECHARRLGVKWVRMNATTTTLMLMMEHAVPLTRSTVTETSTNYRLWKGKCSTPQKTATGPVGQKTFQYKDPILKDWKARVFGHPKTMTSATSLRKNRNF